MSHRSSFFALSTLGALIAAVACSSNPSSATCDAEVICRLLDSDGLCTATTASGPCQSCPKGYVEASLCPSVDPIPPQPDAAADGNAECLTALTCWPLPDSGQGCAGGSIVSANCTSCPAGYETTNECGGTCLVIVSCYKEEDGGVLCSDEKDSAPCAACPAGYVTSSACNDGGVK